ncbi:MAG: flagellar motor switch protein FliG, partial [Candidatus Omnitrophica bacterium]|nr:flagellar motor switch protein FliG [Candidatus Omnitrophota bacterium]
MPSSATDVDLNIPDFELAKLTKVQKLAALLVMLGPDSAAQILRHFAPHEIEVISGEMAKFDMVSQELQEGLLQEFSEVAVQAGCSIRGGVDYTRTTLEKALGLYKASEVIGRVAPASTPVAAMQDVVDMDARQIYNLVRHEQPQTVALIMSYVGPEKSAEILACYPSEHRYKIVERIATLAPIPIEVLERVVQVLAAKRGISQTRAFNQTGGVKSAADLLNAMDKTQGKSVLTSIEERNPDLGLAIRKKMFAFEDLVNLDSSVLQRVLREVDLRDLAMALKTASDKLKAALLRCISRRAAETVQEELPY